jgi:hypothetical protein
MAPRSIASSTILGWLVGLVLNGIVYAITPWQEPGQAYPYWALAASQIGAALIAVGPGFAAGYFAGRSGFWVGATSGVLTALSMYALSATISWPSVLMASHVTATFATNGLSAAVAGFITNGLSGIAGQYMRVLPSNPALNTDAARSRRAG